MRANMLSLPFAPGSGTTIAAIWISLRAPVLPARRGPMAREPGASVKYDVVFVNGLVLIPHSGRTYKLWPKRGDKLL